MKVGGVIPKIVVLIETTRDPTSLPVFVPRSSKGLGFRV